MAASKSTVEQVLSVVEKHVPDPVVIQAICVDLMRVPGNKSFRMTIEMLHQRAFDKAKQGRLA